jgi:methylated-DNA-[protein]-cysteine S-methyltransferase
VENKKEISQAAVYDALMHIPRGKLTTYGDIAISLGRPGASRAVGRILNKNPNPVKVPCHRVVMSDGTIGGYAFGKSRKRQLLESEGIYFDGDSVVEFNKCRVDSSSLV